MIRHPIVANGRSRRAWWNSCGLLLLALFLAGCGKGTSGSSSASAGDLEKKAAGGDRFAQAELGRRYLEGRGGVSVDYAQAARWLRSAAEQGVAEAQYHLGTLAEAGRGLPKDDTNALSWFRQAAERGHADAQYSLALMYATGRGTPKRKEESVKWFRASAEQGLAEAQFNLAQRYQHGQGVATNLVEAYKWFSLAGRQGIADANQSMTQLRGVLSAEQVSQAESGAAAFKPQTTPAAP